MGLVNTVVPLERLEEETVQWCREMLALSPFALRLLKASFNAAEDGLAGLQQLAHDANLLFYMSEEAQEGRDAYGRSASPTSRGSPAGRESRHVTASARPVRQRVPLRIWLMAARPRTLPAAIAPVLVGTALAGARTSSARSPSARRWSAASSSRSGRTSPTTTPTRAAAPTPRSGWAPCA